MPRLVVMTEAERHRLSSVTERAAERNLLGEMAGLLAVMVDLQMGKLRFTAFPWDTWMAGARATITKSRQILKLKPTPSKRKSKKKNPKKKKGAA